MFRWCLPFLSVLLITSPSVGQIGDNLQLFWNLYGAVVTGSRILHDVTEGVGAVSKAIKAIDSFLDLSSNEKPSEDTATNDLLSPIEETNDLLPILEEKVSTHVVGTTPPPVFNGCGALGFHIRDGNLPVTKMTECCAAHDKCYESSCRVNKRDCDSTLRSCLFSMCEDKKLDKGLQKSCRSAAHILFSGTMALSYQQLNDAQFRQDCKVNEKPSEKKKNYR